jgi:hypothetical protein
MKTPDLALERLQDKFLPVFNRSKWGMTLVKESCRVANREAVGYGPKR